MLMLLLVHQTFGDVWMDDALIEPTILSVCLSLYQQQVTIDVVLAAIQFPFSGHDVALRDARDDPNNILIIIVIVMAD